MISKSLVQMVFCRWREFKREPSAMFFVVLMPILWMVILGLAFSGNRPEHYSIGIVESKSQDHAQMTQYIESNDRIDVVVAQLPQLKKLLVRGEILCIVDIPLAGDIAIHFDPSNPEATRGRQYTHHVIQNFFGRTDPRPTVDMPVEASGSRYIDFLIPGLIALSLFTSSLFGTGMTIVANRRENLLKLYMATPMNPYEYIVSHIVGRYLIFAVEFACILLVGMLFFKFRIQGSFLHLVTVGLLATACFTSLAILCGSRTANSATYNGINNLITFPMMMLSGIWFSRSRFPDWLDSLVNFLPLTACVDGLRKIALEGAQLSHLSFELGILAFYTVLWTVSAKITFRWY